MEYRISRDVERELRRLKRKDTKLFRLVEKQLTTFERNHRHPSLRTHKLTGKYPNIWSISISMSIRMLYIIDDDGVLFFDIGTHQDVYQK